MERDIVIPKDVRPSVPEWIHETRLGHLDGARRQYRHGNLHVREYEDAFVAHTDKVDPRKDPLGHIIHDAPEVMAGIVCGALAGWYVGSRVHRRTNSIPKGAAAGLVSGALLFKLGMGAAKRLREM